MLEQMKIANKRDLITAIDRSAEELHQQIEMHRKRVASMLGNRLDEEALEPLFDFCPLHSREARLKQAIVEAIEVLEESRKAFKSKRLEALRKKLTVVLIEHR
jgi:Ni2+-binding GTPase involved in maturation of urease and hydrogenase